LLIFAGYGTWYGSTRGAERGTLRKAMSSPAAHSKYSIAEYVRLEDYSNVRHEFLDGQVYARAGGTPEHGAYAANVIVSLASQLRDRPCRVHTSDVRVRVSATGLDTYPDVSIVCGNVERDTEDRNAITNPAVLVEVLSPATEEYDRGEKLEHYKKIPALRAVLFVAHDERRIDLVARDSKGAWTAASFSAGQSLRVDAVDCTLAVDDVYRNPVPD
jgi:Uma2 family endonuclease